jgi:predicted dehydrogenase
MSTSKVKVGIIGCGNISPVYFRTCKKYENLDLCACADLALDRAQARAREFEVARACSVDEMLADKSIEIIINLTVPSAHYSVARAALLAGKSVYNEKPLSIARDEGRELVDLAGDKAQLIGGAPDTFLGAGIQTCRKLIDDGAIGQPIGATAFMMCHGPESWHPDPEFYYKKGGGPMFDMGPYYLTALVALMGSVRRVTGSTRISFPERTITSKPKNGTKIVVDVPTHVAGLLDFSCGAVATIVTSFDVHAARVPTIEIYGTEGSLSVPDPNGFGGTVSLFKPGDKDGWREIPLIDVHADRGTGVADMAASLRAKGRPHRANGDLTMHVLDIMHAIHDASNTGVHVVLKSTCEKPRAMVAGLLFGTIDA